MEIQKIKATIEAILFAVGRTVTQDELVLALEIDKNGTILNVYPLNDDAKIFKQEDFEGKKIEEGITKVIDVAKDYLDEKPEITVDSSAVNTSKTGSYKVKYTVKDQAANINEYECTITVVEKKVVQTVPSNGEKIVYLTFDAGYDNGNIEKIVKILKE